MNSIIISDNQTEIRKHIGIITKTDKRPEGQYRELQKYIDSEDLQVVLNEKTGSKIDGVHTKEDYFNCFMFAYGKRNSDRIRELIDIDPLEIYFGTDFTKTLIERKIIERKQTGNVIIYFEKQNSPTHVGLILTDNSIISKWGTGYIYKHKIWEVPIIYGNSYELFSLKEKIDLEELFMEYIINLGYKIPN